MVKKILKTIKKDLQKSFDLNQIDKLDEFSLHFGVCFYIRNKYLWNNPKNVEKLNRYFKCKDIDSLSHAILFAIIKKFSPPNLKGSQHLQKNI